MNCNACDYAHYRRNLFGGGVVVGAAITAAVWKKPHLRMVAITGTAITTLFSFKWALRYQKSISECAVLRY